jgi:SAM-dependent methyltransferase
MARDHYYRFDYDIKERFCSYWHQIDEVVASKPKNVLEIGIGNGIVSSYLAKRGIEVVTLDVDPALGSDVVGSALGIPFVEGAFDVVACYEVLEHLPYPDFRKALDEIRFASNGYVVLSLPDRTGRAYRFLVQIPRLGEIKKHITLPRWRALPSRYDGQHYWEIGTGDYSAGRIISDIQQAGFQVTKNYRVFEYPYHHFFVLQKT